MSNKNKKPVVTITVDKNCPENIKQGLLEVASTVIKNHKKDEFLKLKKSSDKAAGY